MRFLRWWTKRALKMAVGDNAIGHSGGQFQHFHLQNVAGLRPLILTGAILLFTLAVQTAVAAPYTGKLTFPLQSNQTAGLRPLNGNRAGNYMGAVCQKVVLVIGGRNLFSVI